MQLDGETPTPRSVEAWVVLGVLPAERVPMWAAEWIVQGYGGEALVELAGLSGRDSREVRDLLPAAVAELGVEAGASLEAACKVEYDRIAGLYLAGRASWGWVLGAVVGVVSANDYAGEVLNQPLGELWAVEDELGAPWGRVDVQLAEVVRAACVAQLKG
jgi:hypothetical protein